jgi:hypothetical protein
MNKYGSLAQDYWKRADRTRYEELSDPETFFEELGEQVLTQVDRLLNVMERDAPADEDYLGKVGRLNALRNQAEEIAMTELVYISAVPSTVDEELEMLEMQRPSQERIAELLEQLEDREPEMATDDYEAERSRLLAMQNPL